MRAGEIVGLAGIMGAGRTELLTALYGAAGPGRWSGVVEIDGAAGAAWPRSGARAREGLGFVTDDRRGSGLMLRDSVGRNLVDVGAAQSLAAVPDVARPARTSSRARRSARSTFARRCRRSRSGRFRAAISRRWCSPRRCSASPRLLLLDEPTRGVDVGAKGEIYARIRELAGQGLGVLIASSEMPELLGLCDRVVVLRRGQTVAEFPGGADEHEVLAAAEDEPG